MKEKETATEEGWGRDSWENEGPLRWEFKGEGGETGDEIFGARKKGEQPRERRRKVWQSIY